MLLLVEVEREVAILILRHYFVVRELVQVRLVDSLVLVQLVAEHFAHVLVVQQPENLRVVARQTEQVVVELLLGDVLQAGEDGQGESAAGVPVDAPLQLLVLAELLFVVQDAVLRLMEEDYWSKHHATGRESFPIMKISKKILMANYSISDRMGGLHVTQALPLPLDSWC